MRIYSVHDRPAPPGADPDVVLVKEGFCWPALFVPALWLLFRRQWLGLVVYLAAGAGLGAGLAVAGMHEVVQTAFALSLNAVVALFGNDLRRWSLGWRGYELRGVVSGAGLEEAERRLFDGPWLAGYAGRHPRAEVAAAPLFPASSLGGAG